MAFDFDGGAASLRDVTGYTVFDTNTLSFSCMVDVDTSTDMDLLNTLASGGPFRCGVQTRASGGLVKFGWECSFDTTNGVWSTDNTFALNTTHVVVVTYDKSSVANNPVIYVNGVAEAITEDITPVGTADGSNSAFQICNGGPLAPFNGTVQEVAGWTRILTAAEAALLGSGLPMAPDYIMNGIGAHWRLIRSKLDHIQGRTFSDIGSPVVASHLRVASAYYQNGSYFTTATAAKVKRMLRGVARKRGWLSVGRERV